MKMKTTVKLAFTAVAATFALAAGAVAPTGAAAACANEAVRVEQKATYLPDCRGFELVTPANKSENEALSPGFIPNEQDVPYQAKAKGAGSIYQINGGTPESESAVLFSTGVALGGGLGSPWSDLSIAPTSAIEQSGHIGGNRANGVYTAFSRELTCGAFSSTQAQTAHLGEGPPLLPSGEEVGREDENLYLWRDAGNMRELITNVKPRNPEHEGLESAALWIVEGMSEDCQRVAFTAPGSGEQDGLELPLTKGSTTEYAPESSIYEWSPGGEPHVASLVPDEEGNDIPAEKVLIAKGATVKSTFNTVSQNGKHLFFTAEEEPYAGSNQTTSHPVQIFDRYEGKETFEISKSQTATPDTGAFFVGASSDGSHVFFIADHGLTPTTAGGEPGKCSNSNEHVGEGDGCDLYEFYSPTGDPNQGSLTDLTPSGLGGTAADVRGVLGLAEGGEYVYFDTSAQLTAGQGKTTIENEDTATCKTVNVYGYHFDAEDPQYGVQHPQFIANISLEESGGPGVPGSGCNVEVQDKYDAITPISRGLGMKDDVARVSPNGEYLLFATTLPQTPEGFSAPYDNEDAKHAGRLDPMLYEYKFTEGPSKLRCVSCEPNGAKPEMETPFSAKGPFSEVYGGVLPNNVLDNGQVYFTNYAPLVTGATPDRHAYEYQPPGYESVDGTTCEAAKGCISRLEPGTNPAFPTYIEGVSEDGENVYLTTVEPLAAQDHDGLRDLYDVRVGGGQKAEPAKELCNLDENKCQGQGTEGITGGGLGSAAGGEPTPIKVVVEEPAVSPLPPIRVLRRAAGSRSVTVTVRAPGAGDIQISGGGLIPSARSVGKGIYRLRVSYTKRTLAALRRRHAPRIAISVTFTPAGVTERGSHASWSFRA